MPLLPENIERIEFLEDGEITVERYRSNGPIDDETVFEELFALCSEDDVPLVQTREPK